MPFLMYERKNVQASIMALFEHLILSQSSCNSLLNCGYNSFEVWFLLDSHENQLKPKKLSRRSLILSLKFRFCTKMNIMNLLEINMYQVSRIFSRYVYCKETFKILFTKKFTWIFKQKVQNAKLIVILIDVYLIWRRYLTISLALATAILRWGRAFFENIFRVVWNG